MSNEFELRIIETGNKYVVPLPPEYTEEGLTLSAATCNKYSLTVSEPLPTTAILVKSLYTGWRYGDEM